MQDVLALLGYIAATGLSILALRHSAFKENLLQNVGLTGLLFAGTLLIKRALTGGSSDPLLTMFVWGIVIYGLGTLLKVRKFSCEDANPPASPGGQNGRRSTPTPTP